MIKYFYFLFLFISNLTFSQVFKDSLLVELALEKNDSVKVKKFIAAGDNCYYTHPDSSYALYKEALKISREAKDIKFEALSLLNIGYYLDEKERYEESLDYYLNAIDLYNSINNKQGLANSYNYIGYSFSYLNSVDKATEYYFKALHIFKELNDEMGIADIYNGFGNLYYDIENYEEAYKYYLKAFEIYKKKNDKGGLLAEYINLGNAISEYGELETGLEYYLKSIKLCKELDDKAGEVMCYSNIGECYLLKNKFNLAEKYLAKALKLSKTIDYKSIIPVIYSNIAHLKLKVKQFDSVINYVDKSIDASKELSIRYFEYETHNYLSEAYSAKGDFVKSLKHYKIYKKHTDSVFKAKKFEQVSKLSVLNKLEVQDDKIELMTKNEEITSLQNKNQLNFIYILLVFSIFFIVLTYILIRQRVDRKKAYNLLVAEKNKAEESDKLKSAFLANMSHEIRTPMNAIMGFSGLLKSEDLKEEKRNHFIDIINISGERLMAIINDIIDISKIESNQLKIDITEFNVNKTLFEIVEIQNKSNKLRIKKNIKLEVVEPILDSNFFIKTDKNRFTQILDNLINNAIKFTDEGSIIIGFNKKVFKGKTFLEFYVKDSGCGIPQDKFNTIFNRFSQAGKDDYKQGNGLGLSICKGLITLLNGQIWLESEEKKGTTFFFTLPY
ncbi:ATP-binding protein [Lutibacter sp. TH_r2]|uniref:tetratricopeptide repeat-containing sensor histidine kinase n=1 Tax=Lutibacter sp. TH_r2 TaxID=3082083 RepID=UPI002954C0F9|nr:tetratricopeptide repeat protein [Lutibacter sp. TH_r2]MDV7186369.1 ATP-binding protein [Lutibacter sp. TH_r2]